MSQKFRDRSLFMVGEGMEDKMWGLEIFESLKKGGVLKYILSYHNGSITGIE